MSRPVVAAGHVLVGRATRDGLAPWLLSALCVASAGGCHKPVLETPAPESTAYTIHRLNRAEYNNTVRDLLGTKQTPADRFPLDDRAFGFDNIGSAMSLSPTQIQLYADAAEALIDEALAVPSPPADNPARRRILVCDPASGGSACVHRILAGFLHGAWRRPATDDEVAELAKLVEASIAAGDTAEDGVALALQAALVSPRFVFRVELDPDPGSTKPHRLGPYELASRLSYFLWSSMPDAALFDAAASGTLDTDAELAAQTARMLANPKAVALVDNFAGQWLYIRGFSTLKPWSNFPDWDEDLRAAITDEARRFFASLLEDGTSVERLLDADYTFANDRLARHYGLPAVGAGTSRVPFPPERRGVLGQAGVLTVTSMPARTSPVKRGVWVLGQLLCDAPSPPPQDFSTFFTTSMPATSASNRDRLAQHARNSDCAGCHLKMDPIGLSLERFDAIGAFRTSDPDGPIDDSAALYDGTKFHGEVELTGLLAKDPRFLRCVVKQLSTYAMGAGVGDVWIDAINQEFAADGANLRLLIGRLVASDLFRTRLARPEAAP